MSARQPRAPRRRGARHPQHPSGSKRRAPRSPPRAAARGMTLAQVQQRVDAWISQFEAGYWPPLSMLARLTEEVGELARELNHDYGHKPKKRGEPPGDIALEIADIVFVLVCLCNSLHIDLGQAFERVMQKYEQRDAGRWTPRQPRRLTTKRTAARGRKP